MRAGPLELAVDATLRARMARGPTPPWRADGALDVRREDVHRVVRGTRRTELFVLVVDASDSMAAQARMAAAKGAVFALLLRAHVQRDRVALVAFEGTGARVVLPATRSAALARTRLAKLSTGGATPLAAGLWRAWQVARAERRKDPALEPMLVLLTDGEANVARLEARPLRDELRELCVAIRADHLEAVVVDTNGPFAGSQALIELSGWLGAGYHHVQRVDAKAVVLAVMTRRSG